MTTPPIFFAMLRIKNEARWLPSVLPALSSLCRTIFVLDDHSTDSSRDIILAHPDTVYLQSPFTGLNETRDKNWLLDTIILGLPQGGVE